MDYYSILPNLHDNIQKLNLYGEVVKQQKPLISRENLLRLIEAKRNSIKDFKSIYSITIDDLIKTDLIPIHRKEICEFALINSKNKLLFDIKLQPSPSQTPEIRTSFDGNNIITLMTYPNGHKHAGIKESKIDSMHDFFQPYMPLALSMLYNTEICQMPNKGFDLLLFLKQDTIVVVYEKKEVINGSECIVVADLTTRLYLDISKDFSVVRAETYTQNILEGQLMGRWLTTQTTLFDLTDYGNGVWLPNKAIVLYYDQTNKATCKRSIEVLNTKLNDNLKEDYFVNFIPADIMVVDTVNNTIYKWGDSPSIGGLLKETVKPRSTSIYNWISIIVGLIMIVIARPFKIRERILKGRAS
ncbi:MAG: hypothetical protein LBJ67_18330 [Planctomycetaceae bacterium]|jgi:hypothetical protein|nr:hypothetical protein [Planctomycetaceae bacterium]